MAAASGVEGRRAAKRAVVHLGEQSGAPVLDSEPRKIIVYENFKTWNLNLENLKTCSVK